MLDQEKQRGLARKVKFGEVVANAVGTEFYDYIIERLEDRIADIQSRGFDGDPDELVGYQRAHQELTEMVDWLVKAPDRGATAGANLESNKALHE